MRAAVAGTHRRAFADARCGVSTGWIDAGTGVSSAGAGLGLALRGRGAGAFPAGA